MTTQHVDAAAQIPADTFPLRLAIARFNAGHLTAEKAGALVGVTGTTWLNWERGKHLASAMKPAMLSYIARQLECDEGWLREGGPLVSTHGNGPDGGRPRQDSNLRPADYQFQGSDLADLAKHRDRRNRTRFPRRRPFRRGIEAA